MLAQVAESTGAGAADNMLTVAIVLVTVLGLLVALLLKRWYGYG
jgi:hypothetical protein